MELFKEKDGEKVTISLVGKFDYSDTDMFREVLVEFKDADIMEITLDISRLTYIDSAALGMFLIAKEESNKTDKKFVIIEPTGQPAHAFTISQFDTIFEIQQKKAS